MGANGTLEGMRDAEAYRRVIRWIDAFNKRAKQDEGFDSGEALALLADIRALAVRMTAGAK